MPKRTILRPGTVPGDLTRIQFATKRDQVEAAIERHLQHRSTPNAAVLTMYGAVVLERAGVAFPNIAHPTVYMLIGITELDVDLGADVALELTQEWIDKLAHVEGGLELLRAVDAAWKQVTLDSRLLSDDEQFSGMMMLLMSDEIATRPMPIWMRPAHIHEAPRVDLPPDAVVPGPEYNTLHFDPESPFATTLKSMEEQAAAAGLLDGTLGDLAAHQAGKPAADAFQDAYESVWGAMEEMGRAELAFASASMDGLIVTEDNEHKISPQDLQRWSRLADLFEQAVAGNDEALLLAAVSSLREHSTAGFRRLIAHFGEESVGIALNATSWVVDETTVRRVLSWLDRHRTTGASPEDSALRGWSPTAQELSDPPSDVVRRAVVVAAVTPDDVAI